MAGKFNNVVTKKYRSKLEQTCATLLREAGIPFEYEKNRITLQEKFRSSLTSWEKDKKLKKLIPKTKDMIRAITYTPDFVGKKFIIETKGMKTSTFNNKWKMFKKYLIENNLDMVLFMPSNKKEILQTIKIIKDERLS